MNEAGRIKGNSEKKKKSFLFYFILLNLTGVFFLSLFNYHFFYAKGIMSFEKNFADYRKGLSNASISNLDKQIKQAFYISELYFTDVPQNRALITPQDETIESNPAKIIELINALFQITSYYPALHGIDIYYANTDTIVTKSDKVHFECTEEDAREYLPWLSKLEGDGNSFIIPSGYNSYPEDVEVITYVKKLSSLKWNRDMYVAIHVNSSVLDKMGQNRDQDFLVVNSRAGIEIYRSNNKIEYNPEILLNDWDSVINIDGNKYIHSVFKSNSTGFVYHDFISLKAFVSEYIANSHSLKMQFVFSVAFNIIVLFILTCINYSIYVKSLHGIYKKADVDIREKTQSLDKALNMLEEDMRNLSSKSKNAEIMNKRAIIRKSALSDGDDDGVSNLFTGNKVIALLLTGGNEQLENIEKSLSEMLDNGIEYCYLTISHYHYVFFVFNASVDIYRYITNLDPLLKCRMYIGQINDIASKGIRRSYLSAYETFLYSFMYPGKSILDYRELCCDARNKNGNHLKYLSQLERDIKCESPDVFMDHFGLFRNYLEGGNFTVYYCLSTIADLVSMIYNYMLQCQLDSYVVLGYDIREKAKDCANINEFEGWIKAIVSTIYELKGKYESPEDKDANLAMRLEKFIDDNLENDLSLTLVSSSLGIRSDILSKEFKDLIGKNFIDYVRDRKLQRAIVLLDNGYNVNEISDQLGYRSTQYFIKIFKEVYGMTPLKYKKSQKHVLMDESGSEEE